MRLPVAFFLALAGAVSLATGSAAQRARKPAAPPAVSKSWNPIPVASWAVPAAVRGMRVEASSGRPPTDAEFSRLQSPKELYGPIKDALLVARLDALRPSRLEHLPRGDVETRRSNVLIYMRNLKTLDPLLDKVTPSPECGPCRATSH